MEKSAHVTEPFIKALHISGKPVRSAVRYMSKCYVYVEPGCGVMDMNGAVPAPGIVSREQGLI